MNPQDLLRQGIEAARAGRRAEARDFFIQVVDLDPQNQAAWLWLTGYVDDLEDKIIACENVLTINPANEKVRSYLATLLAQRVLPSPVVSEPPSQPVPIIVSAPISSPVVQKPPKPISSPNLLGRARQLEQEGKLADAISTYELLAAQTKDSRAFDNILKQIERLEALQKENIQHVSPITSIARMSTTWVLVYVGFVFVQVGLKPLAYLSLLWLWAGVPFVGIGSFMLALSEIRVRHALWRQLSLSDDANESPMVRGTLAVLGWLLVLLPFALILLNSLARLRDFQVPPEPFLK
jgi:tetratricopeptide (TPR) repeat protein